MIVSTTFAKCSIVKFSICNYLYYSIRESTGKVVHFLAPKSLSGICMYCTYVHIMHAAHCAMCSVYDDTYSSVHVSKKGASTLCAPREVFLQGTNVDLSTTLLGSHNCSCVMYAFVAVNSDLWVLS